MSTLANRNLVHPMQMTQTHMQWKTTGGDALAFCATALDGDGMVG
jgi:hypothetical protein